MLLVHTGVFRREKMTFLSTHLDHQMCALEFVKREWPDTECGKWVTECCSGDIIYNADIQYSTNYVIVTVCANLSSEDEVIFKIRWFDDEFNACTYYI